MCLLIFNYVAFIISKSYYTRKLLIEFTHFPLPPASLSLLANRAKAASKKIIIKLLPGIITEN